MCVSGFHLGFYLWYFRGSIGNYGEEANEELKSFEQETRSPTDV